jgi:hypothetical protein
MSSGAFTFRVLRVITDATPRNQSLRGIYTRILTGSFTAIWPGTSPLIRAYALIYGPQTMLPFQCTEFATCSPMATCLASKAATGSLGRLVLSKNRISSAQSITSPPPEPS